MSFAHLHVHSHYSLLDGFGTPKDIVLKAKALGCPAVALTDHGNLYGAIEFYKAAKAEGIKPIIGCEVYVAPGSRFERIPGTENKPYHLILLATNNEGYLNLLELVSKANLEGFYYKPRMDHGLMKAHSKGLIALSACLAGEVAQAISEGNEKKQLEVIDRYQETFGKENFFLELQHHPLIDDQKILNERLIELSKITGAPLVATQDSHYINKNDALAQDILLCIQTQTTLQEQDRMKFQGDFSMWNEEEMLQNFQHVPEALENTVKIAERCNVKLDFGKNLMPVFKTPGNETAASYLRKLCEDGLCKKYGQAAQNECAFQTKGFCEEKHHTPPENAVKQLNYELEIVHNMGFEDYFLIVYDFVKFAKDRGITVGPGRGSAAGSIITYALNITQLNPLKYGLIFERFLNPERVSMPDIDIDFADTRRNEVLEYVTEKYGRDCVAQIITFGTMAARAAVRDVGRAMAYPYAEVDHIAKLVPPPFQGRHIPLKILIETTGELQSIYTNDSRAKALLDHAIKLEGSVRHAGTHASAVVMSQKPLVNYTPLQRGAGGGEEVITQYSMKPLDEIGLLKMDLLGLKNLTIIQNTLQLLKTLYHIEIDLEKIPMDDQASFELLQKGDTTGIFQLESAGMRHYIKELKPTRFEDIIAMISLYRPGPMEWIPQYIKSKHNPETIRYAHPSFEKILKETNGVAMYQEQILEIARDFAGFSLGEADILRKAVGKKNPILLKEQKEKFIEGAKSKGHQEKFALEVFEKVIEPFAGYGFNKAHAACYAMISYQTAWLKARYPTEFMAALLSADHGNTDRIILEINECNDMNIDVLPPSIDESFSNFTVVDTECPESTQHEHGDNRHGERNQCAYQINGFCETKHLPGAEAPAKTRRTSEKSGSPSSQRSELTKRTIRFGLKAIKGLGEGTVDELLAGRKAGKFVSLENFLQRVPAKLLNKKTIEALAWSGALDQFGERKALASSFDTMGKFAKYANEVNAHGQTDIFGMLSEEDRNTQQHFELAKTEPATLMEKLDREKEYLGLYVSGHPLRGLTKYMAKKVVLIEKITGKMVNKTLKIGGLLTKMKKVFTKAGSYMVYGELEDPSGRIEIVIFPKVYNQFQAMLKEGELYIMEGRLDHRRDTYQFSCNSIRPVSLDSMIANAKAENLYNEKEKIHRKQKITDELALLTVEVNSSRVEEEVGDPLYHQTERAPGAVPINEINHAAIAWQQEPYIIEIPDQFKKEKLEKLKSILLKYPGHRGVEIHIRSANTVKRIRVPFEIELVEELEKNIEELVTN